VKKIKKDLLAIILVVSACFIFSCEKEEVYNLDTSIDVYDLTLEELMQIEIIHN
jgi:hypothetical protein